MSTRPGVIDRSSRSEVQVRVQAIGLAEFDALAPEWDALVRATPRPDPYALHGWIRAWLGYLPDQQLHGVVAYRGDRLIGAAALFVRTVGPGRLAIFAGAPRTVPKDILVASDAPPETAAALVDGLRSLPYDWMSAYGILGDGALARTAGARLQKIARTTWRTVDLSDGHEALLERKLSSKHRRELRRYARRGADQGVAHVRLDSADDIAYGVEAALALHARRWANGGDVSSLASERGRRVMREALAAASDAGVVRVDLLRGADGPIASGITLQLAGVSYAYRQAYDPAFLALAPGEVLRYETMRHAAGEGCHTFDMSDGAARWNLLLSDEERLTYEGIGLSTTAKGAVAARMHAVARRAVDGYRRRRSISA
jgi:CelD/BcsL family acetyltransferase involved in cellulose biosynthesis